MSKIVKAGITCPHCGKSFNMDLYRSIWGEEANNLELVLSDKINVAHCPFCHEDTKLPFSLFYTNTPNKIAVWWEPEFDPEVEADMQGYKKLLPESHLANAPRIRDWEEFKKKIIELESAPKSQEIKASKEEKSNPSNNVASGTVDISFTLASLFFLLLSFFDYKSSCRYYDTLCINFPLGFYTILKFVICGYFAYNAHLTYLKQKISFPFIISVLFAIVYNPFVKVIFEKETWNIINIMTFIAICVLAKAELLTIFRSYNSKQIPKSEEAFEECRVYPINNPEEDPLFFKCRDVMGRHIQDQMNRFNTKQTNSFIKWLRVELTTPSFDDMNFTYKNQVFSLLLDIRHNGESLLTENKVKLFKQETSKNNLVPCLFPVDAATLQPIDKNGWNLFDINTNEPVNPTTLATNTPIKMSDWELSNFAIQIVRDFLKSQHLKVYSFCDAPGVKPQIWFENENGQKSWVLVKYCMYPQPARDLTYDEPGIEPLIASLSAFKGYFAAVAFCPKDNQEAFRGSGFFVSFDGLKQI